MTVNIGVIGLGMIGQDHLKRFANKITNAKITAVCDINKKVADSTANEFGAKAFYDANELINSKIVDAIFICSVGPVHKEQILAAIKAGKPTFCEKPLTPTADEAKEIIDAEVRYGKRMLQLGFMRRFDPGYVSLKETIDSGKLGEIMLVHCAHRNPSVPANYTYEMPINDSATHEIDIIRYLLKEDIVSVRVDLPKKKTHRALPHLQDPLIIVFETSSGIRIDDELFVNCNYGYDICCEVIGEDSIASLNEQALIETRSLSGAGHRIAMTCMERFATAYDKEVQNFVDRVAENSPMTGPSSWDGYLVALVCDAGVSSLKDGEKHMVTIPPCPDLYK